MAGRPPFSSPNRKQAWRPALLHKPSPAAPSGLVGRAHGGLESQAVATLRCHREAGGILCICKTLGAAGSPKQPASGPPSSLSPAPRRAVGGAHVQPSSPRRAGGGSRPGAAAAGTAPVPCPPRMWAGLSPPTDAEPSGHVYPWMVVRIAGEDACDGARGVGTGPRVLWVPGCSGLGQAGHRRTWESRGPERTRRARLPAPPFMVCWGGAAPLPSLSLSSPLHTAADWVPPRVKAEPCL